MSEWREYSWEGCLLNGTQKAAQERKICDCKEASKGGKAQLRGGLEDPRRRGHVFNNFFGSNKHNTWISVFFTLGFISQLVLSWDGEEGAGGMIRLKAQQKGNLHLILDGSEQV